MISRWLSVPVVVVLVAIVLAMSRAFDRTWVTLAFAVFAIASLYVWQRATYRLSPTLSKFAFKKLGSNQQHQISTMAIGVFIGSTIVTFAALCLMVFLPDNFKQSGYVFAITLIVWSGSTQFGVVNVLSSFMVQRGDFEESDQVQPPK